MYKDAKKSIIITKLSLASFVSMTTAASAAVEDASLRTYSSEGAAIQDQKHRHDHHHVGNSHDQHQQQPSGLDNVTSTAVVSALFHNKEHNSSMDSCTITSGSDDGVTGDVDVDGGAVQARMLLDLGADINHLDRDGGAPVELTGPLFAARLSTHNLALADN